MTDSPELAQKLVFVGKLLVRGVVTTCIFLGFITLVTPSYVIPAPGESAVVIPIGYLVGQEYARGWFFGEIATILFYWSVYRTTQTNRIGFATAATILTLITFAGRSIFVLNLGVLEIWFPLLRQLTKSSIYVPVAALFSIALVLWNVGLLMSKDKTQNRERTADEQSLTKWLDQHRWLVVARFSGYTLVAACVVAGIAGVVNLPLVPEVWDRTTPMFLLFAAAVYGFVSSDYALGTGTMAVGAWITGLAALQYDSATSGVVLPMAVLLTISATGMVFEDSRLRRNSAETETSPEGF